MLTGEGVSCLDETATTVCSGWSSLLAWVGGLRPEAVWGPAECLLACFENKHELWLGADGCHHATGKATPGMEKEKPVREIQQLS